MTPFAYSALLNRININMHAAGEALTTGRLRLFVNTPVLNLQGAFADFVEPTFTGYAPVNLAGGDFSSVNGSDGVQFLEVATKQFKVTATAGADVIRGWWISDLGNGGCQVAAYLDAPVPMSQLGQALNLTPNLGFAGPLALDTVPSP